MGVATVICHLKEKLKIISAPIPTDKGQEQSSLRVVQWLLITALDLRSILTRFLFPLVKMQKTTVQ